jgi:hypothetical protein
MYDSLGSIAIGELHTRNPKPETLNPKPRNPWTDAPMHRFNPDLSPSLTADPQIETPLPTRCTVTLEYGTQV